MLSSSRVRRAAVGDLRSRNLPEGHEARLSTHGINHNRGGIQADVALAQSLA